MRSRTALVLIAVAAFTTGCLNLSFLGSGEGSSHFGQPRYHTVKPGETLYSIAWTYGYDYQTVARWNNIKPPYTIYVGQRLRVAPPAEEAEQTAKRGTTTPPTDKHKTSPSERDKAKKQQESQTQRWSNASIIWQWPTQGPVLEGYSATNKGLNIGGSDKQPVYAAAEGVVVYSGSGLRGYGNLIIIKHNDVYLSAYAHNREIFVKEGTKVAKGQLIATMGNTESDRVMLHFEIRRDGKPVDPIAFLPKRN